MKVRPGFLFSLVTTIFPSFMLFFSFPLALLSQQKEKLTSGDVFMPRRSCHGAEIFFPLGFVCPYDNTAVSLSLTRLMDVSWYISKTALGLEQLAHTNMIASLVGNSSFFHAVANV